MTQFFEAKRLDSALRSGESTDPRIMGLVKTARQLEAIPSIPPLESDDLNTAKAAFLSKAAAMAPQQRPTPVAAERSSWLSKVKESLQINQRRAWVPVTAFVALMLVFLSVFGLKSLNLASQVSLPGDPLYTYKIVKEDINVGLTFDAYQKVQVYLGQIQERQEEILRYAQSGQAPPPQTVSRLEKLLEAALIAASQLSDSEMQASLAEIRQASEDLGETIAQAKPSVQDPIADPESVSTFEQVESAANNTVALADQGLRDPEGFRVNMAAPKPHINSPAPTSTAKVVYPQIQPTPVVRQPTPTLGVMNPPLAQPTPTCTCEPTQAVQEPVQPSNTPTEAAQPTQTNPPPIMPTPTEIYIQPTQVAPTPTTTPTITPDAGLPLSFPTPTPVQRREDGN